MDSYPWEDVLTTGDAHVARYSRRFDELEIELVLWNEEHHLVRASGVERLHDSGTWECDGIIRYPDLDDETRLGYAIVDTEQQATLRFNALQLRI